MVVITIFQIGYSEQDEEFLKIALAIHDLKPIILYVRRFCRKRYYLNAFVAIHKTYGSEVLKGVDDIKEGEIVSIVGSSAPQKHLLHILGTLDRADKGEINLNGVEVTHFLPKNWLPSVITVSVLCSSFTTFTRVYCY